MYINAHILFMRIASSTELRNNLAKFLDQVHDDHMPMIITREGGKPAAVIMSFEDYTSHEETIYLLRSPNNAKRLLESIAELDARKGVVRTLIERTFHFRRIFGKNMFIGKPKTRNSSRS